MNLCSTALPITIALITAFPAVQLKFRQSLQSACSHACCLSALLGHVNSSAAMYNSRATKQRWGLTWRLAGAAMQNCTGGDIVREACSTFVRGEVTDLRYRVSWGFSDLRVTHRTHCLSAGIFQLLVFLSKACMLLIFFPALSSSPHLLKDNCGVL